jgi:hypothetical protein
MNGAVDTIECRLVIELLGLELTDSLFVCEVKVCAVVANEATEALTFTTL